MSEYREYPRWVHQDGKKSVVVHSAEEEASTLAGWGAPPAPAAPEAGNPLVQPVVSPFDHDLDGNPGGSVAPEHTDELKTLRAEYQAKFGKKPFAGWKPDVLRAKLAE